MLRNIKILTALLFLINTANAQTVSPPTCSINGATITCPNGSLIPGGVPGGSNTQIQFNDSGAFGGISGWTTNGSTLLTGSTTSFLNWTGRAAITSPADGQITLLNNAQTGFTRLNFGGTTSSFPALTVNGSTLIAQRADGGIRTTFGLGTADIGQPAASASLTADAADTLAQRNGTNAQTFRVYNTYTDASNYERGVFDWSTTANTLTIGTTQAGTGASRNIQFIRAGSNALLLSGGTAQLGSLNLNWSSDNANDIGADGANRPRIGYFGTNLIVGTRTTIGGSTVTTGSSTAIPAGGSNALGFRATSTANFGVFFGSGAPTLSAAKGSLYLRSDGTGTNDRAYINTDGGTTWTNLVTGS